MIRVIGDRIIIAKGDTGTFAVPNLYQNSENDDTVIAVLTVYDMLYRTKVIEKIIAATDNLLTFELLSEDTNTLEPRTYYWDIKIYHNPIYDDEDKPIDGSQIDSYYGTRLKLPKFIVKGGI